jgi:nitronate monooxygenase
LYAGQGVGALHSNTTAAEVVDDLATYKNYLKAALTD